MRSLLLLVICSTVTAAFPRVARANSSRAEQAAALVQEGVALGKQKQYEQALARFKQAEVVFPEAEHDCWIGLSYFRMHKLSQAQYFFDRCQRRAQGAPNLPWLASVRQQIAKALAAGGYSPVSVKTQPEGATVRAPGFAADEALTSPVTVWLPPGKQRFIIESPQGGEIERSVAVEPSWPRTLQVALAPPPSSAPAVAHKPHPPVAAPMQVARSAPSSSRGAWSWIAVGGGAAAAVAGGVFHYLGWQHRQNAQSAMTYKNYKSETNALETDRALAFGLYAAGAVAIGTGIYLLTSEDDEPARSIKVGGALDGDGAAVSVWGRF